MTLSYWLKREGEEWKHYFNELVEIKDTDEIVEFYFNLNTTEPRSNFIMENGKPALIVTFPYFYLRGIDGKTLNDDFVPSVKEYFK